MKKIFALFAVAFFASGSALANADCAAQAVDKNGKPLAGAAKSSFMKKCQRESCSTQAIDKNGKPLAGAAKNSFMKKCQATQ
ncbi:hypothetical protein [Azonexus sp.]|uniref:hypothetical protein n=1 Tax=Azonexus sp. TaxID=1872668 RepID=UPI0039E5C4F4